MFQPSRQGATQNTAFLSTIRVFHLTILAHSALFAFDIFISSRKFALLCRELFTERDFFIQYEINDDDDDDNDDDDDDDNDDDDDDSA